MNAVDRVFQVYQATQHPSAVFPVHKDVCVLLLVKISETNLVNILAVGPPGAPGGPGFQGVAGMKGSKGDRGKFHVNQEFTDMINIFS